MSLRQIRATPPSVPGAAGVDPNSYGLLVAPCYRLSRGWVRKDGSLLTETGCMTITITVTITMTMTITMTTVSFHNLKSQSFKLSISNPKSKYVVYLSVLSQISNCQGLGRKKTNEILKTDRTTNFTYSEIA